MSDEQLPMRPDQPGLPANATLPEMVRFALASGKIADVEKLLEIQTAWELKKAEEEFIDARARLEFPPIPRSKKSLNSYYAPLENIQEIVNPILKSEGFTLDFTSSPPDDKGMIAITGTLSRGKHSKTATIFQPIGAASKGMNANQAMASAVSYGERYLMQMMLNLRFIGMDDDAQSFSYISENDLRMLEDMIQGIGGFSPAALQFFLNHLSVKSLGDIPRRRFEDAKSYINGVGEKRRKSAEKLP